MFLILMMLFLMKCTLILSVFDDRKSFDKLFHSRSILAFGDSLTHGFIRNSSFIVTTQHPYTLQLQSLVNSASVTVIESGLVGELTSSMIDRLPLELSNPELSKAKLVIILGGTNDLGHRRNASSILGNLLTMHKYVHSVSEHPSDPILTVAIGIPEVSWRVNHTARAEVNKGLKLYAEECSHLTHYVDFEKEFNQSNPATAKYWGVDRAHFSIIGYDEIGRLLFDAILHFSVKLAQMPKTKVIC